MRPFLAYGMPLCLCLCCASAAAEKMSLGSLLQKAVVDMPATTAPAAFLLGASGQQVPRLSTFREFGTQIARAYDENGELANAVAAEIAPSLVLGHTSWDGIVHSWPTRVLSRTTVSFATKVGENNGAKQTALGLQSVLYSREMDGVLLVAADDRCRGAARSFDDSAPPLAPPGNAPGAPSAAVSMSAEVQAGIEKCQEEITGILSKWNQTMLAFGAGRVFSSGDAPDASAADASAYWLTGSYGGDLGKERLDTGKRLGYLLTAHVRHTRNAAMKDIAGNDILARQRVAGLNLRYGNPRLAGIAEYSILRSSAPGLILDDRKRALLGLEYKVADGMYLTLGVSSDRQAGQSKRSMLANVNWGIAKSSVIFP
ncbi:hypothetical protein [Janthinobacterium sp. 1_2014MBL_MicDiv]|uniref:hypothetical protein n=1 Tax=Janthinobacterium sp. 1_2014MBL_MicDiv TaxID=1644131 RepID=UPI0008F53A58|nr:hypothetical protein [Janthinobacterium sp. 1_2014MBL_MicDiv]APA68081.1 hypothetical protein YQ44_09810 [Janthinobacterium sp. 1_2014MBL_MicDiv]